jgi:hypothetical protein
MLYRGYQSIGWYREERLECLARGKRLCDPVEMGCMLFGEGQGKRKGDHKWVVDTRSARVAKGQESCALLVTTSW